MEELSGWPTWYNSRGLPYLRGGAIEIAHPQVPCTNNTTKRAQSIYNTSHAWFALGPRAELVPCEGTRGENVQRLQHANLHD